MTNMIRNISQTVQERELVKTAPDIVVYLDGLPYLQNIYVTDPSTNNPTTLVNFNNYVTQFNAAYDVDLMVPSASIGLQVPNYDKYLFQMPGGNNLIETMMQVQVYAKGYYMSSQGDTVYRRVFKGVSSHIGYSDDGKMLEISIQCYGTLYMLELMQINLNPAVNTAIKTGVQLTTRETIFGDHNPYRVIADAFVYGLKSDGFQLDSLSQPGLNSNHDQFSNAVQRRYIAKWQSILNNLTKDVHVYGSVYKDNPDKTGQNPTSKRSPKAGAMDDDTLAHAPVHVTPISEADDVANNTYYSRIADFHPFSTITGLQLTNNNIVNRLELIRRMVNVIGFEAYQDIDGKIIVKPPLFNLDVVNLGQRSTQNSTAPNSPSNSQTNNLTQIYPESNPFVVHLAEILTENESEDQAAIRRTRTTVCGNLDPKLVQVDLQTSLKQIAEYIDISKLAKFGLREEPPYSIPWISLGDHQALFSAAIVDTVKANRGYRTYTFTIPMRPELKLGFPIFIPHKDIYAYIKNISIQYQVGQSATMTVTCDSVRRRVLINTQQQTNDNPPKSYSAYVSAPNLVYKWAIAPASPTQPNAGQSSLSQVQLQSQQDTIVQGNGSQNTTNLSNPVGADTTIGNTDTNTQPSPSQTQVRNYYANKMGLSISSKTDSPTANWTVQNDTDSKFTAKRPVEYKYMNDILSTIPFTDEKGYEVIAPFPWGRYVDLNTAIKTFTQQGWVTQPTDINGNPVQNAQEVQTLQTTDAFIFAGLGTPTATNDNISNLSQALQSQQNLIGGSLASNNASTSTSATGTQTTDATIIVLKYDGQSQSDSSLLNTAQPEDALAQSILNQLTNLSQQQQLINVLVSGTIAPSVGTQEALLATTTQTPLKLVTLNPVPGQ